MPRLAICSRDLHWQWINWAPLYDTMEVSVLHLTWLTVAQRVFQPALTGRLELISRKIISCEPGTKAIAVSRFREKLSPANWVQGVTAISRKISRSNMRPRYIQFRDIRDRDISGLHCTELVHLQVEDESERIFGPEFFPVHYNVCCSKQRCQPLLILLNHYSFWCCKSPCLLNISNENQEN